VNEDRAHVTAGNPQANSDRKVAGSRGHKGRGTRVKLELQEGQKRRAHDKRAMERVKVRRRAIAMPTAAGTDVLRSRAGREGALPGDRHP
jgi:hypothetical protein